MIQDKVYDINKVKFIQVYDVISWLNKNLETLFDIVWYLEKERKSDVKTYSTDRVSDSFMEKVCRKSAPRTNSKPLFNFGK